MSDGTALLIDFGSTYTKLRAVDLDATSVIGSGQGPSTVTTDITAGMNAALADLERNIGGLPVFRHRLASSSAAGGLAMVTVGLVPGLTAEAARRAALGAGARLMATFAYQLTAADVQRIVEAEPDILLLAGGTDGGDTATIVHNANALGASALTCPIVLAGNRSAADEVQARLETKNVIVADNVMPEFNVLDIESARDAIRRVFIAHIVHAKGIDRAHESFDQVLMPTPAAVLEAARLLADGAEGEPGLGDVLLIDPGGATTDVHSVCTGGPSESGVVQRGLPEPRLKRTVEGDLGMRHNAAEIVRAAGIDAVARDADLPAERVSAQVEALQRDVERLPQTQQERALDRALAAHAVRIAVRRHAGSVDTVYTATGPVTVQYGKDLGDVGVVIGSGGVLVHADDPRTILRAALADPAEPFSLRPRAPRLLLDSDYIVYACGLLSQTAPGAALRLARRYLQAFDEEMEREYTGQS